MEHYSHLIPGWFDYADLYEEVVRTAPQNARLVEIGSYMGASIAHMAVEAVRQQRSDLRIYAVDLWDESVHPINDEPHRAYAREFADGTLWGAFLATLKRGGFWSDEHGPAAALRDPHNHGVNVAVLRGHSARTANAFVHGTVHFAFIDAAHDEESVERDIRAWLPKIAEGGILAGHDLPHGPVKVAVEKVFGSKYEVRPPSCWLVRR